MPKELGAHDSDDLNRAARPDAAESIKSEARDGEEPDSFLINEFDRIAGDFDYIDQSYIVLRRGDLVELPYGDSGTLAVFLRMVGDGYQYYTIFGKIWTCRYRNATFIVKNFLPLAELDPIMPYVPSDYTQESLDTVKELTTSVPRSATTPILERLVQFRRATENAYRTHSSNLDNAHELLAHATDLRYLTLEDATTELTGVRPTKAGALPSHLLYAVSNALLRGGWGFSFDPKTYAECRVLAIESRSSAAVIDRVRRWVRAYQEVLALKAGDFELPRNLTGDARIFEAFVEKSKTLIEESRKLRFSDQGNVLACRPEYTVADDAAEAFKPSLAFSKTDQDFIKFLGMSACSRILFTHSALRSLPSVILRATGMYETRRLDLQTTHTFLVEIGVLQPHENPFPLDREVIDPDAELEKELGVLEKRIQHGEDPLTAANLKDSMQAMRKDWGDLRVICVDSEKTREVDDGISVEPIAEAPGQYWLHSHISHISAFTSPNDVLGRQAKRLKTSLYMSDAHVTMLPSWVSEKFSIAPGSPVLTFSARVDAQGEILEKRIQPGLVRNVVRLNYQTLDSALGFTPHVQRDYLTIRVGPDKEPRKLSSSPDEARNVTEGEREDLDIIYRLCRAMAGKRPQTPFNAFAEHQSTAAWGHKGKPAAFREGMAHTQARFALQNPTVELSINKRYEQDVLNLEDQFSRPSNILVQEMMLMSGLVAAEWSHERNLPIIFQGTRPATDGVLEEKLSLRREFEKIGLGEQGWSRKAQSNFLSLFALRFVNSAPVEHKMLGFKRYAKVTSPLRRFYDLLSHWQIDAALRQEAADEGVPNRALPFARRALDKLIRLIEARSVRAMRYIKTHQQHWNMHCIARAHLLKEATMPEKLTALIGYIGGRGQRHQGRIQELELSCDFSSIDGVDGNTCQANEIWEVVIEEIRIYGRKTVVKPIRRLGTFGDTALRVTQGAVMKAGI